MAHICSLSGFCTFIVSPGCFRIRCMSKVIRLFHFFPQSCPPPSNIQWGNFLNMKNSKQSVLQLFWFRKLGIMGIIHRSTSYWLLFFFSFLKKTNLLNLEPSRMYNHMWLQGALLVRHFQSVAWTAKIESVSANAVWAVCVWLWVTMCWHLSYQCLFSEVLILQAI